MEADGVFCITALGSMLGSHAHPSVRSWAIYTARVQWEIWGHLVDSVRSGESARKLLTGREGYAHLADDSKVASIFNDAMSELSRIVAANVAHACDFASAGRIVDVGGGHGELLATIVAAHPHLRGVLFDLPHAMAGANAQMVRAGVTFESVAGSFFEAVPRADVHILKSILHNWSDDRCLEILGQCRRSVAPGGRLLIIERVMPDRITSAPPHRAIMRADLNMMVSLGGRERTESEFDDLMAAAEYARERSVAIGLGYNLIEARANRSKP